MPNVGARTARPRSNSFRAATQYRPGRPRLLLLEGRSGSHTTTTWGTPARSGLPVAAQPPRPGPTRSAGDRRGDVGPRMPDQTGGARRTSRKSGERWHSDIHTWHTEPVQKADGLWRPPAGHPNAAGLPDLGSREGSNQNWINRFWDPGFFSVGQARSTLSARILRLIPLPEPRLVKFELQEMRSKADGSSVANLAGCRFELVHLRVSLAGDPSLRRLPVELGARAIVQGGVHVHPDWNLRVAGIRGWRRCLG